MNLSRRIALFGVIALSGASAFAQATTTPPSKGKGHAVEDIADMQVLETLRRSGADLGKPHTPVYFTNYPTESASQAARKQLEGDGFKVVKAGRSGDGNAWILILTRTMPLSMENVRRASRSMTAAVEKNGGRYDGWEAEPRK
jgi:hypothetical protein